MPLVIYLSLAALERTTALQFAHVQSGGSAFLTKAHPTMSCRGSDGDLLLCVCSSEHPWSVPQSVSEGEAETESEPQSEFESGSVSAFKAVAESESQYEAFTP